MSSAQRGCGVTWTFSRADEKKSELTSTSVGNSPKIEHRGWTRWLPESPSNRCLCDPMKIQCRNLIAQDSNSNLGNKHSGEGKAYLSLTHGCTKKNRFPFYSGKWARYHFRLKKECVGFRPSHYRFLIIVCMRKSRGLLTYRLKKPEVEKEAKFKVK